MSNLLTRESGCAKALQRIDAHLDNQITDQERSSLAVHLAACQDCRRELDLRTALKARVRTAVKEQPAPPYLAARVRANLSQKSSRLHSLRWATVIASVSVLFLSTFVAYQLGYLRLTRASQDTFIASISQKVAGIMAVGLREHVHCSVFRKYRNELPSLDRLRQGLPAEYQPVLPVVTKHVPPDFRVAIAHDCGYGDREVIHVGLKSGSKLMSLIITRKRAGDTFTDADVTAVLAGASGSVYHSGVQRFQIAAIETTRYLVYLVSDLPRDENTRIMLAMAPELRTALVNESI